jgi:Xaa-Pro aminopeptidase
VLRSGDVVGIDPTLYSSSEWEKLSGALSLSNIHLHGIPKNLIDIVWGTERPSRPVNPVRQLALEFTGKTVNEKLREIREDIQLQDVETLVLTELDEIACMIFHFIRNLMFNIL